MPELLQNDCEKKIICDYDDLSALQEDESEDSFQKPVQFADDDKARQMMLRVQKNADLLEKSLRKKPEKLLIKRTN